ncbi:MAG: hypothetical protein ABIH46_14115 [Chloroflexota bacterium]
MMWLIRAGLVLLAAVSYVGYAWWLSRYLPPFTPGNPEGKDFW